MWTRSGTSIRLAFRSTKCRSISSWARQSASTCATFPISATSRPPTWRRRKPRRGVKVEGHIVLLCTGFHERNYPSLDSVWKNPLLTVEATRWLHDRGCRMHGVEGPSTDKPTDNIFAQHRLCRDLGISHWEWLVNLEELHRPGRIPVLRRAAEVQGRLGLACCAPSRFSMPDDCLTARDTGSIATSYRGLTTLLRPERMPRRQGLRPRRAIRLAKGRPGFRRRFLPGC